jgi:hypothetical protein
VSRVYVLVVLEFWEPQTPGALGACPGLYSVPYILSEMRRHVAYYKYTSSSEKYTHSIFKVIKFVWFMLFRKIVIFLTYNKLSHFSGL